MIRMQSHRSTAVSAPRRRQNNAYKDDAKSFLRLHKNPNRCSYSNSHQTQRHKHVRDNGPTQNVKAYIKIQLGTAAAK